MIDIFIIVYSMTLIYFAIAERVSKYVILLSIQGVLLFGVLFFSLYKIEIFDFIFILLETILVKAIILPWFMNKVRRQNQLKRENDTYIPVFYSIIIIIICLLVSFLLSSTLQDTQIHTKYFTVAFASVIFGVYFIIVHKNIFSHVVGYLIIENGIFLISLALGSKMPMMVNLAVLLDVLMGVLVLGIFVNRIGNTFESVEIGHLTQLKD
jgi:hydrogenase-4 component E